MDMTTEHKLAEIALNESEERFRATFEQAAVGIAHVAPDGKWIRVNRKLCEIVGYTHEDLMALSFQDITHPDDLDEDVRSIEPMLLGEIEVYSRDKRYIRKSGSIVWVNLTVSLVRSPSGNPDYFITVVNDISTRKTFEERQRLSLLLIRYLNQSDQKTDMIKGITSLIKESIGIESVGIRLKDGEDYPYYHTSGFSSDFVEAESSLCAKDYLGALIRDTQGKPALECMCGNIISGRFDLSEPCFTIGGSFWTNSTTELLASSTKEVCQAGTRNRCNTEGYESVALIPLRSKDSIIGLLQLNDRRRDMFTPDTIGFLEGIASSLGISFYRKQTEESLCKERDNAQRYFDMAGTMLVVINEDQRISLVNKRGCEILGYKEEEEIIGANWFDKFIPAGIREKIRLVFDNLMKGDIEPVKYYENTVLNSSGQERIIAWHNTVLRDESGNIYATLGSGEDITERKRAEEALRDSEARYRNFVENMQGIAFQGKMGFKPYFFHGAVEEITGYREEDFLSGTITWDKVIHPDDMPVILEEAEKVRTIPDYCYADEHRIIRKDGRVSWVFETVRNICDYSGKPFMVQGAIYDINKRKVMEEALRESETRYRNFVESFQGIAFRGTMGFTPDFFHGAVEEITGYTEEDFKACSPRWDQIIHEEDLPLLKEKFMEIKDKPNCTQERIYRIIRKDGETRWIQEIIQNKSNGSPTPKYVEGVIFDITKKKLAEDTLAEREEKISLLLGSTAEGIYGLDMDGDCTFCNPSAARLLGYDSTESLVGRSMHELIHHSHEDGSCYELQDCPIHKAFRSGEQIHVDAEALWRKDGTSFYAEYWSYPIIKGNEVIGAVVTFIDVSQRKVADEMYSSVVKSALDAFWLCDAEGNILDVNDAACRLYGYSREEFIGMHPRDFEADESPKEVMEHTRRMHEMGGDTFQSRHRAKNNRLVDVEVSTVCLNQLNGMIFAFIRDITERKEMEEERLRTQKFESIGLLAGGIAHDFNNILTIINNNISLAKLYAPKEGIVYRKLSEAVDEFSQAKSLTQQLLTLSKGGSSVMESIDSILDIIRHTVQFSLRGSNLKPRFNLYNEPFSVKVDKGQFCQVINNIVINSIQSMPEGGLIDISLENVTLPDDHGLPLKGKRYLRISIADTGTGIPKDIIDRIFDPYFTTKEGGNGLGLSTSYSIINMHEGHIYVESEEYKGTVFHIYLPAINDTLSPESDSTGNADVSISRPVSQSPLHPGTNKKILIMDDEWKILKSMGSLLGLSGFRVNYAADGDRAIWLYEEAQRAGNAYDAVIMDLTIPGGMGGLEAIKRIRQLDPDAKVIVSSGYSSEPVMSRYHEYGFDGAVAKPYDIEELLTALESLLLKGDCVQEDLIHE